MEKYIKKSKIIQIRETNRNEIDYVRKIESAPSNRENVFQWSKDKHVEIIEGKDTLHLIIETNTGEKVGYAIVAGLASNNKSIELRRVVIDMKNQGYGTEFLKLMKEYTFEDLQFHKIWLDFFDTNSRVESLYKRNGFKREGVLRDKYYYNNEYITMVVMSILEDEYYASQRK